MERKTQTSTENFLPCSVYRTSGEEPEHLAAELSFEIVEQEMSASQHPPIQWSEWLKMHC